eukprot:9079393-Pyramimonas_sp.AAC.1
MIRPRRSCFTTRATKLTSILLAACEAHSREIGSNPGWGIACDANHDPNATDDDGVGFTFHAQTGRPRDAEDGCIY